MAAKRRILLVEDEPIVAADVSDRLTDLGYDVVDTLSRGEDVLPTASRLQPDIILMDIRLQGEMDGIQASLVLREQMDIPVVFATAHADISTLEQAQATNPFGYVVKPYNDRELHAAVELALFRHRNEARILKIEKWLSTTLGSIGDAVLATNRSAEITFVNRAAEGLLGQLRTELIGRSVHDILRLESGRGEPVESPVARALESGLTIDLEEGTYLLRHDGSRVAIDDSAAPIRDETGEISGVVVVFRDDSKRRQAEDTRLQIERRMQETQRLESLGLLAGGIVHDFNNLLTVMLGNLEVAIETTSDDSTDGLLRQAETAGKQAADLCAQILAYSGAAPLAFEAFRLTDSVAETVALATSAIPSSIQIVTDFNAARNAVIRGDETQIRQVIMNLFLNAAESIDPEKGGTITVSIAASDGHWVIEIDDTGCGMDEHQLTRIYEPFFTTKYTGRGLGLAAVKGIVESHHGHIGVESYLGEGTTFKIRLPAEAATQTADKPGEERAGTGRGTILVVDDDDSVRIVTERMLALSGFTVFTAASGREAIDLLTSAPDDIDLVMIDYTMPGMSGTETLAELREIKGNLPALILSGGTEEGLNLQSAGFLAKPFTRVRLVSAILKQMSAPLPGGSEATRDRPDVH